MNRNRRRSEPTRVLLLALVVSISLDSVWAQTVAWTRQFGTPSSDVAFAATVDSSGSVYMAGYMGNDAFVRKYNAGGAEVWTSLLPFIPTFGYYVARAVAADAGGNIYVAGNAGDDAFVRKYSANGVELWTRQFGAIPEYDQVNSVAVDAAGNIYVAGHTAGALPGQTSADTTDYNAVDVFVRKYDANGAELWTRQFGTTNNDSPNGIAVDSAGSIYVVGGLNLKGFLRKYSADGAALWTRQFGSPNYGYASGVAVDMSGNIYVAGYADGYGFVRRYGSNGAELWTRQFGAGGSTLDYATGVAADTGGSIYVAGWTPGRFLYQSDAFVRKYAANGSELWARQFGSQGVRVYAVAADVDGSIYVAGTTPVFENAENAWLTKFVPFATIPGDLNCDRRVDCQDVANVRAAFGNKPGRPRWFAPADVVADNVIDIRDLAFVAQKLPAGARCL